jgi:hypothetical protein
MENAKASIWPMRAPYIVGQRQKSSFKYQILVKGYGWPSIDFKRRV